MKKKLLPALCSVAIVLASGSLAAGASAEGVRTASPPAGIGVALEPTGPSDDFDEDFILVPEQIPSDLPEDDPAAVALYYQLRAENIAMQAKSDVSTASSNNLCIDWVYVEAAPEGHIIRVYKKSQAPMTACVNASNTVYEEEYKPMTSSAWHGNKYRDQLVCHIANAWSKIPWNLESWRPDVGYFQTVLSACNPT